MRVPSYNFFIKTALLQLSVPAAQAGVHRPWFACSMTMTTYQTVDPAAKRKNKGHG
jgi:hypothetical protein